MCLIAFALDCSRRFPLVVASNRDEFYDRSTARLAWWAPEAGGPDVLAGRDLQAGGTWLGLNAAGRLGMLTNIRDPRRNDPNAPSRGSIVPRWLTTTQSTDRFWVRTALTGHNGFNLIAADFAAGECYWMSSVRATAQRLGAGVYGLSNGALDEPWPKVQQLKQRVRESVDLGSTSKASVDHLANLLFAALADRTQALDADLPATGIAADLERQLSPAYIRTMDGRYGTRCSTLIISERIGRNLVTHVLERTHPAGAGVALLRRATLKDWPPRYHTEPRLEPVIGSTVQERHPVSEAELAGAETTVAASPTRLVKPRVRSLIKPAFR